MSFNSSDFVVYGDQEKISLHSVLAILTLALSVNYVGWEEHSDEDQNNYYSTWLEGASRHPILDFLYFIYH